MDQLGNFTKLSLSELERYNLVWSVSAMVTAVVTAGILLMLILINTFKSPLQRMLLSLTVLTLMDLVFNSLNFVLHPKLFHRARGLCQVLGYAEVCVFLTSMGVVSGIALYLHFVMYYIVQAKPLPNIGKLKSGALEITFMLAVVSIPPVVLLRDRDKFGFSGPHCWIKTVNITSKELVNQDFELKILCIYTALMTLNVAIFMLLKFISLLLTCRQRHVRSYHTHMVNKAALLNLCLVISFVMIVISLWGHYRNIVEKVPFWVLIVVGLVVPTSRILIPIGFLLYLSSMKKLKLGRIKSKLKKVKLRLSTRNSSRSTEMGSAPLGGNSPSPHTPDSQEVPSYTVSCREVEYTGAFTGITSTYGSMNRTTYSE
jgi:hypothetical protein